MPPTDPKPRAARRTRGPAGPAPTQARLHDTALAYLARFAATEVGLVRMLDRRIDRWARAAGQDGQDPDAIATGRTSAQQGARAVARALVQSGVLDDAIFAGSRARSLTRAGRSRRAVSAHLAAKGVAQDVARAALPDPADELASALAYARRRRLGPFRTTDLDAGAAVETRKKDLGALARAGFEQPVAQAALDMGHDAALALVAQLKRGG